MLRWLLPTAGPAGLLTCLDNKGVLVAGSSWGSGGLSARHPTSKVPAPRYQPVLFSGASWMNGLASAKGHELEVSGNGIAGLPGGHNCTGNTISEIEPGEVFPAAACGGICWQKGGDLRCQAG